jgi:hypothetical protein
MVILTGQQIPKFRLITLASGIRLEGRGVKVSRGRSCLAIVKAEFGFKGNRAKIQAQLQEVIDAMPDTP